MPIRNPFARRPGPATAHDESSRPGSAAGPTTTDAAHPGFERVDTVGSKASSAFSIRSSRPSQDTGEYKMSVAFTCHHPPLNEKKPPGRGATSRAPQPTTKAAVSPSAPATARSSTFSISRESFDSYRRSFVNTPLYTPPHTSPMVTD
ncbi:hypothetical protein CHGG_05927 [Chaetomium globosum CBS 148.51]|uniref:Uncharacterized protein n=1 Tax=Chaetomium globosum (strain ATCC 6205 / CBS 148.51 / DSM 1962 / NBRC 6347 / NRRL 1970) TaxID=306901 RepID=Q2H5Y8_CHAGB|nr:uncharacterized protein CHGG_05927 [Chaetomium globosum CBS 148.51]EAQ89308.1 hypothetical protein CHGG_05927 [Chaetomium globosum CBS 148.51]